MQASTHIAVRPRGLLCCIAMFASSMVSAGEPVSTIAFSDLPGFVTDADGVSAAVRVTGIPSIERVDVAYVYAGEKLASVSAAADQHDASLFRFKIPASPSSGPGKIAITATVVSREGGKEVNRSEIQVLPLAHKQDLDITGDAAIALLYPLGGPEYTVRYVPCCNIFGGITTATRVPVNPESTDAGLPKKLLSDFIVLAPDGLSASTMGMYMEFLLGADRFAGVTPALYEFNGHEWTEFNGYKVDATRGFVSMHCPNGGTFVVAAKP